MEDFAAKVIAAHQAGLAEARQQKQLEQQAEDHKLNVQIRKHELDAAKIQQGLVQRQLDAVTSGGPTGQATSTIQSPTTQPENIAPPPVTPIQTPDQPQNISDLLNTLRQKAQPQMAAIPSGQDTSLNGSVATGTPPVEPDIQIPMSDGTVFRIPRTNLETEAARAMAAKIQELKLEGLKPFTVATGAIRKDPLSGEVTTNPKAVEFQAKEGTLNGLPTTANYNPDTGEYSIGGIKLPAGAFKPKESSAAEAHNTITTDKGIFQYNPKTNAYDIRVGNAPPKSDATVVIQTQDDQGNKVTKIVPKVAGAEYAGAPTTTEQNRNKQADIINREADRILAMIDKTPNAVGPIAGRLARGETVVGTVAPEAKALATALGSFEALQPILHGFRGGSQTVGHFHDVLGDQHLNAAALKASINEIKALAANIKGGKAEEAAPGVLPGFRIVK